MALSARHLRFVEGILAGKSQADAYRAAGFKARTQRAAESRASELVRKAEVAQELSTRRAAAVAAAMEREQVTADRIIAEVAKIAFGDARSLSEYRRVNCRHCWGKDHNYQRTDGEFRGAQEQHVEHEADRKAHAAICGEKFEPKPFKVLGGPGFDCTRAPNPDCPECKGEGEGKVRVADTRQLPPDAVGIFAGVKRTKDGLEVKTYSKEWALDFLGKYKGLVKGGDLHVHLGEKPVAEMTPEERARRKAELQALLKSKPPEKP